MGKLQKTSGNSVNMEFTYNDDGTLHAVAKRRQTKAEKKAGTAVDTESPVIEFDLEKPDEYKCSVLNITNHKSESTEFYNDAIKVLTNIISGGLTVFIRVAASSFEGEANLKESFIKSNFVQLPDNADLYEFEIPLPTYLPVYMSIGTSLGLVFGLAIFDNIIFMSIGIGIGLAVGGGLDAAARKEREALKRKRGNCVTTTREAE